MRAIWTGAPDCANSLSLVADPREYGLAMAAAGQADSDEVLAVIDSLIGHVRNRIIPYLTSRSDLVPRHYAAACLARCNRLLAATVDLYRTGYPDVIGLPLRSLLECWILGMYYLLAPDEAMTVITAGHVYQLAQFDDTWGDPARAWHEELPDIAGKRINWRSVFDRVGELAQQQKIAGFTAERLYAVLYRIDSHTDVHGGIGAFGGHVDGGGTPVLSIREIRRDPDAGILRIRIGGWLLLRLAKMVAAEFGLSTADLGRFESGEPE